MSHITIADEFRDHLGGILEPVELRDSSGKVLGTFTPLVTPEDRALYEKAGSLFNPEELDRRSQQAKQGGLRTTAEVLNRLQSLENRG